MKNHTKVYFKYFGFSQGDFIPCEITGGIAVDISHNDPRGMGGRPNNDLDTPENLMAMARVWHDFLEANPLYYWWFQLVHYQYMITKKPYYENLCSIDDPIFKELKYKLHGKA